MPWKINFWVKILFTDYKWSAGGSQFLHHIMRDEFKNTVSVGKINYNNIQRKAVSMMAWEEIGTWIDTFQELTEVLM